MRKEFEAFRTCSHVLNQWVYRENVCGVVLLCTLIPFTTAWDDHPGWGRSRRRGPIFA